MKKRVKRLYNIAVDIICRFMDDNVGVYAAQASFFIIIAIIPFVMLLLNLLHLFLPISSEMVDKIILNTMPETVQSMLLTIVSELFEKSASASIISISAVSTLWLSSRGVMALYQGINTVYHADMRNYFYSRAMSLLYTIIFVVSIVLTVLVFTFRTTIQTAIAVYIPFVQTVTSVIFENRTIIFVIMLTVIFTFLYKFLTSRSLHLKLLQQVPGAFAAAVGWISFSYLYSLYIDNYSNYSYVYGSLTAIIFFMLWLYFCMNIFLFGAQFNSSFKRITSEI
ncbi:MAG: YihY/virulence factor BrkB family protein [Firmicutes bacterium]|nr:YihY/virulence factor BrkB family protein [Bacillota bacterium]